MSEDVLSLESPDLSYNRQIEGLVNEVSLLRHQNKWSYLEHHFIGLLSVYH